MILGRTEWTNAMIYIFFIFRQRVVIVAAKSYDKISKIIFGCVHITFIKMSFIINKFRHVQQLFVITKCLPLISFNLRNFSINTITMTEQQCKKVKGEDIKIGTHDGVFHCDEILACFMLQQLPKYEKAEIVRTRNEKLLAECNIVVDVGAVFDKDKLLYDHHQNSFKETFSTLRPELEAPNRDIR